MHLESLIEQTVRHSCIYGVSAALTVGLCPGETIHTENSYKFTSAAVRGIAGFGRASRRRDRGRTRNDLFAVTLANAI